MKIITLHIYLLAQFILSRCALYNDGGPVINLSLDNFDSYVLSSRTAWVIEFYMSWCGYCQRFAPTYESFANSIREWDGIVRVGAIDCAVTQHRQLCFRYNVPGYPTIKFISQGSSISDTGYRYSGNKDAAQLLMTTVDYIKTTASGEHVPRVDPVTTEYEALRRRKPSTEKAYLLITNIRQMDRYRMAEVILDLSSLYPEVVVTWAISSAFPNAEASSHPSVHRVLGDGSLRFVRSVSDRDGMVAVIHQDRQLEIQPTQYPTPRPSATPSAQTFQYSPPDGVHSQDLDSNIYFSFWMEIPRVPLTGEALLAASRYINILARYFSGSDHVLRFIQRVNQWLTERRYNAPISTTEWTSALNSLQERDAYVPPVVRWVGCEGSEERYRGYPCSLWTQFHSLTVNAYLDRGRDGESFDSSEVLQTIRGYVRFFFGCRTCAGHFEGMAQHIDDEISKTHDGIMWLWSAHNEVNQRIGNDTSTDPAQAKVQFPVAAACPQCYIDGDLASAAEVLFYLLEFYRHSNVIQDSLPVEEAYLSEIPGSRTESEVERRHCASVETEWSTCSTSCGTGVSSRMSNDNAQCVTALQFRLCFLRPCNIRFRNRYDWYRCPATYQSQPSKLNYASCESAELLEWKYCGECVGRCCEPAQSTTREIDLICEQNGVWISGKVDMEFIDICECERC